MTGSTWSEGQPPRDLDDVADIDSLFRLYRDAVYRMCLSRLKDPYDAEDATQEVFIRAVRHQESLRSDALSWLLTVARNICIDELRRRSRAPLDLEEVEEHLLPHALNANPEKQVVSEMAVEELMGHLTAGERRAVEETCLEDQTHRQAAANLGLAGGTMRALTTRARARIRACVKWQEVLVGGFITAALVRMQREWVVKRRNAERSHGYMAAVVGITGVAVVLAVSVPGPTFSSKAGDASGVRVASIASTGASEPEGQTSLGGPAWSSGSALVAGASPSPRPIGSANHDPIGPLIDVNPKVGPTELAPTDIAPSPEYPQDRTVLAVGTNSRCAHPPCSALLQSRDGGATWEQLQATGLSSTQLLLPPGAIRSGRFYGYSPGSGLQVTTNGGQTFASVTPVPGGGYVRTAPGWTTDVATVSQFGITDYSAAGVPSIVAGFPAGAQASGPAFFAQQPSGRLTLQPVLEVKGPGAPASVVVSCATACVDGPSLPWAGLTTLRSSPNFATDQTILAVSGHGLALSRDGGTTFKSISLPAAGPSPGIVQDAWPTVIDGRLMIATVVDSTDATAPTHEAFTTDAGGSWQPAAVANAGWQVFRIVTSTSTGRLIAGVQNVQQDSPFDYACSDDGGRTWSACGR